MLSFCLCGLLKQEFSMAATIFMLCFPFLSFMNAPPFYFVLLSSATIYIPPPGWIPSLLFLVNPAILHLDVFLFFAAIKFTTF
jgi:hypothetical protein